MADLQNTSRWDPGVLEIKQTSPGAFGLGSTLRSTQVFMGRPTAIDAVITEWELNSAASWSLDAAFARGLARYTITPADQGSRLTRYVEIEFKGLFKLLEPFLNFSGKIGRRREEHEELENLKRLVEART